MNRDGWPRSNVHSLDIWWGNVLEDGPLIADGAMLFDLTIRGQIQLLRNDEARLLVALSATRDVTRLLSQKSGQKLLSAADAATNELTITGWSPGSRAGWITHSLPNRKLISVAVTRLALLGRVFRRLRGVTLWASDAAQLIYVRTSGGQPVACLMPGRFD